MCERQMLPGWYLIKLNDEVLGAVCITGLFAQDSATLVRFLKSRGVHPIEGDVIYYSRAEV